MSSGSSSGSGHATVNGTYSSDTSNSDTSIGSSGGGHAIVIGAYNSVEEGLADIRSSLSSTESMHKLVSNVVEWAELRAAALESQAEEMDRFYIWHTFWLRIGDVCIV